MPKITKNNKYRKNRDVNKPHEVNKTKEDDKVSREEFEKICSQFFPDGTQEVQEVRPSWMLTQRFRDLEVKLTNAYKDINDETTQSIEDLKDLKRLRNYYDDFKTHVEDSKKYLKKQVDGIIQTFVTDVNNSSDKQSNDKQSNDEIIQWSLDKKTLWYDIIDENFFVVKD